MVKVDGKQVVWREGMIITDLVRELGDTYPYAVARTADRLVSKPDFNKVFVPKDAEVFFIPLVAGG